MLKPLHHIFFFCVMLFLLQSQTLKAQTFTDIGFYWEYVGKQHHQITEDFLSYTSAVAHGKSARKVEHRRKDLLQTMRESQKNIHNMPPFEGDKSLRDSVTSYLKLSFLILNEDYGKIVNLEEVAEQSYDAMEAYILAQELANNKLKEAGARLETTGRKFAAAHHLNLIEGKDETSKKMEKAGKVNEYYHKVYLIFFKSYKQEMYLLDAIDKKNINAIEQNRNALLKCATEGLSKLDTIKTFNGDNSLVSATRQLLGFYVGESKDKISGLTTYYIKEEDFQKIKKAMDLKGSSDRTQEDVDKYNKAVNEMNKASNDFNNINKQLFNSRSSLIENWNKTSQGFLDKHTPYHK